MEYENHEQTETLALPCGRTLCFSVFNGKPKEQEATDTKTRTAIFYFHGFPGSRVEARYLEPSLLQRHNVCCIAIDRPGMGESSHVPDRRILDWPSDVLAVADHLGINDFHILAVSGGAPYALACAKEIPRMIAGPSGANAASATPGPGRLRGVAIISGAYPITLGTDGMLRGPKTIFTMGSWLPRAATGAMLDWTLGRAARNADPSVLEALMDKEMALRPEMERQAYGNERVRRTAIEGMRESFRHGAAGVATDLMLVSDWGFELYEVNGTRVHLWHGLMDENVPVRMAKMAKDLIPHVQAHFIEGEGHLSLPARRGEMILEHLLGVAVDGG